jgi:hypothetical protein
VFSYLKSLTSQKGKLTNYEINEKIIFFNLQN